MRRGQRGQTVLLYTLSFTVLAGMVGLTVDVGWMYFREQAIKAAAESAALAGVQAAESSSAGAIACSSSVVCQSNTLCPNPLPSTPSTNADNACLYAKDNGFQRGNRGQTVLIAANTTAAPISGISAQYWVSATVAESSPLTFLSLLTRMTSTTVSKRATAVLVPGVQGGCIYVLDPSAPGALTVTGNGDLQSGCGVWVNSDSNKALQVTGNATLVTSSGGLNLLNGGGDSGSNSVGASSSCTKCIYPSPSFSSNTLSDPLASIPAPSVGGCNQTNYSASTAVTTPLSPGVYCGGITLTGHGSVTLNPGVYILLGGGLNVSSSNVSISGTGVTFYNTGNSTYPYAAINISGGATATLSAPTSGTYDNMLFFGDRSLGGTSYQDTFTGNTSINLTGAIYFKNDTVSYAGGTSSSAPSAAIVADEVTVAGTAYLNNGLSNNGGTGTKIALIE